jgi:15-cis-phytoene synthase
MRQADDISDDETLPREVRRERLQKWLEDWHAACKSGRAMDPVFRALLDATRRYEIPMALLDELVAGTAMDLERGSSDAPDTYATFEDLYRYCYLVASVVGLVCIRIFGYSDPAAEKLAEETGVAFQLTNILRDVAEDAERNRVYLPLEDMARHGVLLDAVLHREAGTAPNANERALLAEMAGRAEEYYRSAQRLVPLIDRESRPALRVLVSIYHALLERIRTADYDVFSRRASVPVVRKMAIAGSGVAGLVWARLSS